MKQQPSLFDEAAWAAELGIATAQQKLERPDGQAWLQSAVEAIRTVAHEQEYLTADDVWRRMGPAAGSIYQSQIGIAFRVAKTLGLIRCTGHSRESTRPSRHRSFVRVWQSLVRPA